MYKFFLIFSSGGIITSVKRFKELDRALEAMDELAEFMVFDPGKDDLRIFEMKRNQQELQEFCSYEPE